MTYKPIDSKRDEFRKFLERAGLIDLVSKCFIKLYEEPEKPENPIEYFRENIGDVLKEKMKIKMLQAELDEAKKEIEELRRKIKKDEEIDLVNKSTDSEMAVDLAVDDVVIEEVNTIENTPAPVPVENLEEKIAEKETTVIPPPVEPEEIKLEVATEVVVAVPTEDKEVVVVEIKEKDEAMEVIAAEVVKPEEKVEDIKAEVPKVELVEETESSKVAAAVVPEVQDVVVVATTESDPKPEEVTKEAS